jgi:hypothetical protein
MRGATSSKEKLVEKWKPRKIYQNINARARQYETYALRMGKQQFVNSLQCQLL